MATGTKKRKASGSESNRTRVKELAGVKRVTASTLAFIMASIAPAAALTRRGIEYHMDAVWHEVSAVPVTLPLMNGSEYTWEFCCLSKSINWFARECIVYKHLLSETVRRHGNRLKLLVYADEVTPGNPLQPDIARKYWAIYVGIKEFGSARLADSAMWLPIALLRSVPSKKIIGGFSNCMRMLFRAWFVAPLQVHTNGIVIDLRDGPTVVTFESIAL